MLVLEEYEHAKARGANILCELTGYGATSPDGYDMVQSPMKAQCCMQMALACKIDYINAHGNSTPVGTPGAGSDPHSPSPTRHPAQCFHQVAIGLSRAWGRHFNEAHLPILMMQDGFVCGSANIQKLDEKAEGMPILRENRDMKLRFSSRPGQLVSAAPTPIHLSAGSDPVGLPGFSWSLPLVGWRRPAITVILRRI